VFGFLLRRLIITIPLILGITLISFLLLEIAPGDYFTQLSQDPTISRETLFRLRSEFALDRPVFVQYFYWLRNVFTGNFGQSIAYRIPVVDLLLPRLWNTIVLSLTALVISWALAIPFGVVAARNAGGPLDKVLGVGSFFGMAIPEFLLAFLAIYLAARTRAFPVGGIGGLDLEGWAAFRDYMNHLMPPAIVLAVGSVASLQRLMRSNVLEELGKDYVRTARAKGLTSRAVLWRHAVPNAINPMITIFGMELSAVASGAALVENIMAWPGLGKLLLEATLAQDIYVVMASLFFGSLLLVAGNLFSDIMLGVLDPRIRRVG
jgi:peptide/nickel transport system permease protein